MALFRTLPTPINDLLPSLMVEVCLVLLAPDVNFFLNSRKQGLPCWRSLSFSYPLYACVGSHTILLVQGKAAEV